MTPKFEFFKKISIRRGARLRKSKIARKYRSFGPPRGLLRSLFSLVRHRCDKRYPFYLARLNTDLEAL